MQLTACELACLADAPGPWGWHKEETMHRYHVDTRGVPGRWRTVLATNDHRAAQSRYAALAAVLRFGHALRLVDCDADHELVRTHAPRRVTRLV